MKKTVNTYWVLLIFIVCFSSLVQAEKSDVLPLECEMDLALSAAPEHLRSDAAVYALKKDGYVKVREGNNPFTCIVNRNHPKVLLPTCFDKEGTATIIPKILYFGQRMMVDNIPAEKIWAEIREGYASNTFLSPARSGVAYMLSRYNRPVDLSTGKHGWFPPHVMFYAPNLTNEQIGHDMAYNNPKQPLPSIAYQGPQGYMISDDGAPRQRSDLRSCPNRVHKDD